VRCDAVCEQERLRNSALTAAKQLKGVAPLRAETTPSRSRRSRRNRHLGESRPKGSGLYLAKLRSIVCSAMAAAAACWPGLAAADWLAAAEGEAGRIRITVAGRRAIGGS
jgi:hypothetical protein